MTKRKQQGNYGENLFRLLCTAPSSKYTATVNESIDDQHGWDFFVEIERRNKANLPADLHLSLIQCFAQIKTTHSKRPVTSLKLSNAIKALQSASPSFVFLFHFKEGKETPKLYGRHIWKDEIDKWLKRARELEQSGRPAHKVEATLSFNESDLIEGSPADWIIYQLDKVGNQYSLQKADIVKNSGYGDYVQQGTVWIGPIQSDYMLADHQLGLLESLPLHSAAFHNVRFGIKSNSPILKLEGGTIKISPQGNPIQLCFSSNFHDEVELEALSYHPQFIDPKDERFRIRIRSTHFDFLLAPNNTPQNFSLKLNATAISSLFDHLQHIRVLNIVAESPLRVEITNQQGTTLSWETSFQKDPDPSLQKLETVGDWLCNTILESKSHKIDVKLPEFLSICSNVQLLSRLLSGENLLFTCPSSENHREFRELIGYVYVAMANHCLGIVFSHSLEKRETIDGITSFLFKRPKIIKKRVFQGTLAQCKSIICSAFNEHLSRLNYAVGTFQGGDMVEFQTALKEGGDLKFAVN